MSSAAAAAAGNPCPRSTGIGESIDAWRGRGAHHFDPVRFHYIETLARRASHLGGEVQRLLNDKVAALLATYGDDLERAQCAHDSACRPAATDDSGVHQPKRGALAELIDHIGQHALFQTHASSAKDAAPGLSSPPELKTLSHFRSTWSKLSAEQRMTQSLARAPANAGPLNSHHLMHRSLMLMRDLSPEYLNLFMSYADALLWLDQVNGAAAKDVPRAQGDRKPARARSG